MIADNIFEIEAENRECTIGHQEVSLDKFLKDPEAVLDYKYNWTKWLEKSTPPETITAHVITVPEGITLDKSDVAGGIVTAWLSEGTVNKTYRVECKVTTSKGRVDERSIWITVQER